MSKVKPKRAGKTAVEKDLQRLSKRKTVDKEGAEYVIRFCSSVPPANTKFELDGPIDSLMAMQILGWEMCQDGHPLLKDMEKNPIVCTKNSTNRPFRMGYAKSYMLDMLRKKWQLNGETIVIDRKGNVQSGQHRLIGLILAEQERKRDPEKWAKYWPEPVYIEAVVFEGISDAREVTDTLDLGQKRTLSDVLFRGNLFDKKIPPKKRQTLCNIASGAARLVFIRSLGKAVSDAPSFPHSEAIEFIEQQHPKLLESVAHIWEEEGDISTEGKRISKFLSLAYASGLHYLMSTCATDPDVFREQGAKALDFSNEEQASSFWTIFADGEGLPTAHPIQVLREALRRSEASSAKQRDEILGMVIKSFNLWMDGKTKVKPSDIEVEKDEDPETGKTIMTEEPRLGGIDVNVDDLS